MVVACTSVIYVVGVGVHSNGNMRDESLLRTPRVTTVEVAVENQRANNEKWEIKQEFEKDKLVILLYHRL